MTTRSVPPRGGGEDSGDGETPACGAAVPSGVAAFGGVTAPVVTPPGNGDGDGADAHPAMRRAAAPRAASREAGLIASRVAGPAPGLTRRLRPLEGVMSAPSPLRLCPGPDRGRQGFTAIRSSAGLFVIASNAHDATRGEVRFANRCSA